MVIGHTGMALIGKSIYRDVPLGYWVVAAWLCDLVWVPLALVGKESFSIAKDLEPGANQLLRLDLSSGVHSHGLMRLLGAAVLLAFLWRLGRANVVGKLQTGAAVALVLVALSHWALDLIVHVPDLSVANGVQPQGWGLWKFGWLSYLLDLGIFAAGCVSYWCRTSWRVTHQLSPGAQWFDIERRWAIVFLVFSLLWATVAQWVNPLPSLNSLAQWVCPSVEKSYLCVPPLFALALLLGILGTVLFAWLMDKRRVARLDLPTLRSNLGNAQVLNKSSLALGANQE